jgi:DNA (cytosine-5)-methyltransferase 1
MKIKIGSDFSGVGAFEQALNDIGIRGNKLFVCDSDYFARLTYTQNYGTKKDQSLANSKEHKTHCLNVQKVFSGKHNLSIQEREHLLDQADEFAKLFSFYYPFNVYDRTIPSEPLDFYMTSPPCQAFSIAGKRLGKEDPRGVLFFNSLEFIQENKPRFFIFENVKGLLSHDKQNKKDKIGETFKEWLEYLGGKSVNGVVTIEPNKDAVPYHIYWKVINAKHHNIPQNRERVFIVGIRDDADNVFSWPNEVPLTRKLKDVLENEVDEKYFLSEKMVKSLLSVNEKPTGYAFKPKNEEDTANTITARCFKMGADDNYLKVKSATSKGYEEATENDSINFTHPNSKTRGGRVGVAQTLDTNCQQGVLIGVGVHPNSKKLEFDGFKDRPCPTLLATDYKAPKCIQFTDFRIRRLTPVECLRLMDFPDSLVENARRVGMSDSQLYKQAGNSICVGVLAKIIRETTLYKQDILGGI